MPEKHPDCGSRASSTRAAIAERYAELLAWVRSLPGSRRLEALVVFDEVYGFLPPHPANPPTKRPLVSLMKQARAFGVGVVVATQNPMDLDYRALSNAGLWWIGRLQTDADRERVLDGLASSLESGDDEKELAHTVARLGPRWFVVKNAHASSGPILLRPRQTMSLMLGPMTRGDIRRAREWREKLEGGDDGGWSTQGVCDQPPRPRTAPVMASISHASPPFLPLPSSRVVLRTDQTMRRYSVSKCSPA
jgi:DNA helicase HerA-like ATPase